MSAPQKTKSGPQQLEVTVSAVVPVNDVVTRFEFTRTDGAEFPPFSGGAHTVVSMQDGDRTRMNAYSLMSNPADLSRYAISVRIDEAGRGGSLFMHRNVKPNDTMALTYPVNLFGLDLRAHKHIFFAGGIGITPFMSMIGQLEQTNGNWELYYTSKSATVGAYAAELKAQFPNKVHIYFGDQSQKIPLTDLLSGQPLGTHAYVCGPSGMINWVHETAGNMGWPAAHVHSEEFSAPEPGAPFEVRLCKSDKIITVSADESLLEAMEREGVDAPFLCRGGSCGQCETAVVSASGCFSHRDHWLDETEQAAGKKIMPCVSRFIGTSLELDI
jgi:ferredoxin-NADP reductase